MNQCLTSFGVEQREKEELIASDPCVLQLVQSIESLLVHGLQTVPMRRVSSTVPSYGPNGNILGGNNYTTTISKAGGSWDFIKCVTDELPESRMVIDLVEQMPNVEATLNPQFWSPSSYKTSSESMDSNLFDGPSDLNDTDSDTNLSSSTNSSNLSHASNGWKGSVGSIGGRRTSASTSEVDPWKDFLSKTRAWLLLALNKNFLATQLDVLFSTPGLSAQFYAPHSVLRDMEDVKDVLVHLDMLLTVDFEINLDQLWQQDSTSRRISKMKAAATAANATVSSSSFSEEEKDQPTKTRPKSTGSSFFGLNVFGNVSTSTSNTIKMKRSKSSSQETLADALSSTGFFETNKKEKEKSRRGTYTGRSTVMNQQFDDAIANVSELRSKSTTNAGGVPSRLAGLGISLNDNANSRQNSIHSIHVIREEEAEAENNGNISAAATTASTTTTKGNAQQKLGTRNTSPPTTLSSVALSINQESAIQNMLSTQNNNNTNDNDNENEKDVENEDDHNIDAFDDEGK